MTKKKRIIPYSLRIQENLHEWLKKTARKNRRSVNSELIVLIEEAIEKQEQATHEPA